MKQYQVRAFFIDKEDTSCPQTKRLVEDCRYKQERGGYVDFAKQCGVDNPSQYWHLIHSWACRSKPDDSFTKQIQCGELIFWMAEVSGAVSESELADLVDEIGQPPHDRKKWNKVIREKCFDRIAKVVEAAELKGSTSAS
jgi:hypothetical protein